MRGATAFRGKTDREVWISTHAPLAGRDTSALTEYILSYNFNPRAPCGARHGGGSRGLVSAGFQPTRPLRGATAELVLCGGDEDFNPRAPCGARPVPAARSEGEVIFQPTRPLRGATHCSAIALAMPGFQPTRPLRGATRLPRPVAVGLGISTHAPLAGRDNFAPRPKHLQQSFQPTRPLRGATDVRRPSQTASRFQPTRPLRGATTNTARHTRYGRNFNPRAPCGARPFGSCNSSRKNSISTHAPLAGRDSKSVQITMHIFAITDKFQMLLHRMPPVRAFCSFLMQENHADFGCEPPK